MNGKRPLETRVDITSNNDDDDDDDDDNEDEPLIYKWNCNQIRTKINQLLRSGEMKVTEFQRSLDINSNSYGRFMKLKGPYSGSENQTYYAAHRYFLKREREGRKMPKPKKVKEEDLAKWDVSDVHIDGEESDDLPIHDTCDDLRPKIQAHLRNPGVTQAALCREIGIMYHPVRPVQSKQLSDFLKKKGPTSGSSSVVYYGGYLYFEKLRIKTGAKKSKKRIEVEQRVAGGMTREKTWMQHYWGPENMRVAEDSFGRVRTYLV